MTITVTAKARPWFCAQCGHTIDNHRGPDRTPGRCYVDGCECMGIAIDMQSIRCPACLGSGELGPGSLSQPVALGLGMLTAIVAPAAAKLGTLLHAAVGSPPLFRECPRCHGAKTVLVERNPDAATAENRRTRP